MSKNRQNLEKLSGNLNPGSFFMPVIGAELEFYLKNDVPLELLAGFCKDYGVSGVKKEKGKFQYELNFDHINDPVLLADRILSARNALSSSELAADFSAKPFRDDYGSALHIHISLLDRHGNNIFRKNSEQESDMMLYAIGGLLHTLPGSITDFTTDFSRFTPGFDAPTTISWGGNNRTVALRIPASTLDPENRRIEHRVPSADADPYIVITRVLEGVLYGISNKTVPETEKIYGDASLKQYGLPPLASVY